MELCHVELGSHQSRCPEALGGHDESNLAAGELLPDLDAAVCADAECRPAQIVCSKRVSGRKDVYLPAAASRGMRECCSNQTLRVSTTRPMTSPAG